MKPNTFYKNFILIALPIAFQNLITSSVNMIDNLMIGQLGDVAIASVGLANKVFYVFAIMVFGLCGGATAFVSQFWGKKDYAGIKRVVLIDTAASLVLSFIFFVPAFFAPELLMKLLSNDPMVIKEGAAYLRIISPSFILSGIIFACSYTLKSLEHPKIPLFASIISICVNTALNYMLIFGKFGMPCLGVPGAAIGTLCARIVETSFILVFTFKKLDFLFKNFHEYKGISKEFLQKFSGKVIPVIANETLWSVATTVMVAIYARISTQAVAAVNVITILKDLTSVFLIGAGSAAGIMLGKLIGLKEYKIVYDYTIKLSIYVPVFSLVISALGILVCPQFLNMFTMSEEAKNIAYIIFIIHVIYSPASAFNHLNICGCLRCGGDSLYCLIVDGGVIWTIGVLGTFISGILLGLPIIPVYIISRLEEIAKAIILLVRILKRKWIKDLVN